MILPALIGIGVLTLGTEKPASIHARESPLCEGARKWAEANADALPTSLNALRELEGAYQRAILEELPAYGRATIWSERLVEISEELSVALGGLSLSQRHLLSELGEAVEHLVALDSGDAEVLAWEARVLEEFPQSFGAFGTLEAISRAAVELEFLACNCNEAAFSCNSIVGPDTECILGDCNPSNWGCGFLLMGECTGRCEMVEIH